MWHRMVKVPIEYQMLLKPSAAVPLVQQKNGLNDNWSSNWVIQILSTFCTMQTNKVMFYLIEFQIMCSDAT